MDSKNNKIEESKQGQVVYVKNKIVQPHNKMKYSNYYKAVIPIKKESRKSNFK